MASDYLKAIISYSFSWPQVPATRSSANKDKPTVCLCCRCLDRLNADNTTKCDRQDSRLICLKAFESKR